MEKLLQLDKRAFTDLTNPLDKISYIQHQFAHVFTFENLDLLMKNEEKVTKQFLEQKLLTDVRGGLCFELNGALNIVLRRLGIDVYFGVATVWGEDGWIIDKTHTINIFDYEGNTYIIDSGSGTNLTLHPLAIDGDSVTTLAGTFRVRTESTERGSYIAERLTEDGWTLRYAFTLDEVPFDDLQRIKQLVLTHPESPFNKDVLVAKMTDVGTLSINNERLNEKRENGKQIRHTFSTDEEMLAAIKQHASSATYAVAKQYVNSKK
ncbi:MAG TPA: arylamine N-acetyltransferase [Bacillota bacterium]|nr:arylamine N-acetyltransferase [Bacillota bacterium]